MVRDDLPEDGSSDEPAPTEFPSGRAGRSQQRGDVTQILSDIEQGDGQAAEQLLPLVYAELRKLAAAKMAQEKPGQTLQATALVHDAYIRLVDVDKAQHWDSRGHFFSAAAEAMRRILVERARRRESKERHGFEHQVDLENHVTIDKERTTDLLSLDEALTALDRHDSQAAEFVKLRFFGGLTHEEAAHCLGVSRRVADRLWKLPVLGCFGRYVAFKAKSDFLYHFLGARSALHSH